MSKEIIQPEVQDGFIERLWTAWRNGVECEVYVNVLGQWYVCYIRSVIVDTVREIVQEVEVVCKDTIYSVSLNRSVMREYLRIPPDGPDGKIVDGTVVAIDGKKLPGSGNV